ncbi:hypothetical protein ACFL5P_00435 [candidate division KSB1 bacterium]
MRLYSYIVIVDSGFAPNPFGKYCTLACCKPKIRATAQKDDWIVGLSKKAHGNKLIYVMKVTEPPLTFTDYYQDERFQDKKPDTENSDLRFRRGDNIYEPYGDEFKQLSSAHSNKDGSENPDTKQHDLGSKNVLVSSHFYYFGTDMIDLPENLNFLIVGRAHRCRFTDEQIEAFLAFIKQQKRGIHAPPNDWKDTDNSWRSKCR